MISIKIDISDAQAKLNRLDIEGKRGDIAKSIAQQVIRPNLAKYPGQTHAKQPFVSDKQRRYFFAALKKGAIQVPYQRTGGLGSDWAEQETGDGLTLMSNKAYSDLVRTKGQQAKIHESNWSSTEAIAEQSESDAALAATAELVTIIAGAGLQP